MFLLLQVVHRMDTSQLLPMAPTCNQGHGLLHHLAPQHLTDSTHILQDLDLRKVCS